MQNTTGGWCSSTTVPAKEYSIILGALNFMASAKSVGSYYINGQFCNAWETDLSIEGTNTIEQDRTYREVNV